MKTFALTLIGGLVTATVGLTLIALVAGNLPFVAMGVVVGASLVKLGDAVCA